MTLFFIRHGETVYNREGRVTGQSDIPLGPRGLDQAAGAGRTLRKLLGRRGIDPASIPFHASPLERAVRTAQAVRTAMGLEPAPLALDPRLMELSLGAWEGSLVADIERREPEVFARRRADPWTSTAPGGETYADLAARVGEALGSYPRPCVLVAHAGTGRAVLHLEADLPRLQASSAPIHQGRVLVVENRAYRWS